MYRVFGTNLIVHDFVRIAATWPAVEGCVDNSRTDLAFAGAAGTHSFESLTSRRKRVASKHAAGRLPCYSLLRYS